MLLTFTFSLRRSLFAMSSVIVLSLSSTTAPAQKVDKAKLETAARRAGKAVKVLTELAALPPSESIPKELLDKAKAIAVFPDTDKVNILFMKMIKGFGIASKRIEGGWSTPAFYGFAVIDRGWSKVKSDEPGIIMLFMGDSVEAQFTKDHINLVGSAGPVGELTPEMELKTRGAGIIIYALSEGKLRGVSVDDDSTTQSGIGSDNHINKAVFGLKARDVIAGKTPLASSVPAEVTEFQKALTNLSDRR
jgi:lipid-binding SYLF domain-containing protein